MFPENDYLYPPVNESSRLLVGCNPEDYSASRIAHAVEDCNAQLLNLNVTMPNFDVKGNKENYFSDSKFPVVIDIRVNHRNVERISRSLERYGYSILETSSTADDESTQHDRLANLIRYLEV